MAPLTGRRRYLEPIFRVRFELYLRSSDDVLAGSYSAQSMRSSDLESELRSDVR